MMFNFVISRFLFCTIYTDFWYLLNLGNFQLIMQKQGRQTQKPIITVTNMEQTKGSPAFYSRPPYLSVQSF
jgi:hypothetical protein